MCWVSSYHKAFTDTPMSSLSSHQALTPHPLCSWISCYVCQYTECKSPASWLDHPGRSSLGREILSFYSTLCLQESSPIWLQNRWLLQKYAKGEDEWENAIIYLSTYVCAHMHIHVPTCSGIQAHMYMCRLQGDVRCHSSAICLPYILRQCLSLKLIGPAA